MRGRIYFLCVVTLCAAFVAVASPVGFAQNSCSKANVITQLRDAFGISYEEATDQQLKESLKDRNRCMFAQAMLKQLLYGQQVQQFLVTPSRGFPPAAAAVEIIQYYQNTAVMTAVEAVIEAIGYFWLTVLGQLLDTVSTIKDGWGIFRKFTKVLVLLETWTMFDFYIHDRERDPDPQRVFGRLVNNYGNVIDKILCAAKPFTCLRNGIRDEDRQNFAHYLEFCYQSWELFNDQGRRNDVKRYILANINHPPIANAGPDKTVQVGSPVRLNGSGSDPDGDPIKSYRWDILPGENSAQCVFKSSRNIAQPTIQPRREGSCTIELVVSDGKLKSVPDRVTITAKTDITPPVLIQNFLASDNEDSRSTLTWTNPSDSDLSQVIVKRKTTGYPVNHEDGETRLTIDSATPGSAETFVDTGLTNGTTYYYAVFSRDQAGNWNDQVVEGKNADTGRPQVLPPPPPPSATAPWPMFQHDTQRSGRSPYVGPQGPNVKWTFQDSSIPFWEPVVAADGTIYVGGGYTGDIGGFYAIKPDGSLKWVNNSIRVFEGPVLGPEGQIYVIAYAYPDNNPFLLALNPDGTERWRYEWFSIDYYDAELVIDPNGNIYHLTGCYSQNDQRVHPSLLAFNPQGSIIWLYDITDRQTYPNGVCAVSGLTLGGSASSALDKEGNIYAVVSFSPELDGTILFALRPDGTEKWRRTFDGWAAGISIDQDGTIYASVGGYGKIYAIDPSSPNHDKWVVYVQGLGSAVTIGTEDIYVTGGSAPDGTWRSYLYAFDKQGNAKWQKFIGYGATSVPILGGDGTIYIGARQWMVYAFRPDGSEKWSSSECAVFGDDAVSAGGSLAIAADGTLYTAGPQKLCAFGESVAGSTSAPGEVLAVQAYPGSVRFLAAEAMALRVEVFNLAGRKIYDSGLVSGNSLYWDGLMSDGRRLANGVYLYVITYRREDGTILRSEVKKLVILR
jgi:hypothetical protein